MNKLRKLFFIVFFLIQCSDIYAQQIQTITVTKDNKIDQRDYLQNQENCIFLCSINDLSSFKQKLEKDLKNGPNIFLIQLKDLSSFEVHEIDLVGAIVFKLPYELNEQLSNKTKPADWSIIRGKNDSSYMYLVQRSAIGQCSKEEKILLFQDMFLKCLDLIEKSKNSLEFANYKLNILNDQIIKNNQFQDTLNERVDSLENALNDFKQSELLFHKEQNYVGSEWNNSIASINKSIGSLNLQKINYSAVSMTWRHHIDSNFEIGIGYQYGKVNFRTFTNYDSTSISIQSNLGLNITKSTIIRNLTENNSLSFNAILLNFGYVKDLRKKLTFDLSTSASYCPRLFVNTNVIDGFADYKGFFDGVNETLTNVADLGLQSNVSLLTNEYQTTNSLVQFSLCSGIQYSSDRIYSRLGVGYFLLFLKQNSNAQNSRSNALGEFNSSISTLGNFSLQSITLSLTAGIKF